VKCSGDGQNGLLVTPDSNDLTVPELSGWQL